MTFKNRKHAERFFITVDDQKLMESNEPELMASVYLLTCYKRVWKHFENALNKKNGIKPEVFENFVPQNASEQAIVTAAYDLYFFGDCINLTDLTDRDMVPDSAFLAICNAIGYLRYGFKSTTNISAVTNYD